MKFSGTDVDAPPTNRTKFRPDRASRFRHVRYRSTGTGVAGRFSRPVNGFASMFRPNGGTHDDAVNVVAYVSTSSRMYQSFVQIVRRVSEIFAADRPIWVWLAVFAGRRKTLRRCFGRTGAPTTMRSTLSCRSRRARECIKVSSGSYDASRRYRPPTDVERVWLAVFSFSHLLPC